MTLKSHLLWTLQCNEFDFFQLGLFCFLLSSLFGTNNNINLFIKKALLQPYFIAENHWRGAYFFEHVNYRPFNVMNLNSYRFPYSVRHKGQLISKYLFGVFNFFQKMNKNMLQSSKIEFICSFFGRIHGLTICFRDYLTFSYLFSENIS